MASKTLVLPGETISPDILPIPTNPNLLLKLGPGLRHVPPSTITSTIAGPLCVDQKKNAIWVENNSGRVNQSIGRTFLVVYTDILPSKQYIPQPNDLIIATVHHSSTDFYSCSITPHTTFAQLPQLAFEGATKKTRPQLNSGSLIYARVLTASKHTDPEIVCYNPSTGKSEGMGELKGGMVFDVSMAMARRLLMAKQREDGGIAVLEEIAEKMAFEVAVGRNGKVWVKSGGVKETLLVGRALQEADVQGLGVEEQVKLVRKMIRQV